MTYDIIDDFEAYNKVGAFIRSSRFRSSILNKFKDSLTLNLYSILIEVRRVKLYFVKLFKATNNYKSTSDY